jgi:lambda repressor-like predicted transcriptional regulator
MEKPDYHERIRQLEDDLKVAEQRIVELKAEVDEARNLVTRMEDHVKDSDALIDSWIEGFEMYLNENGDYTFADGLTARHDKLFEKHVDLLKRWNKLVPRFNAVIQPKEIGRPLAASEAQCATVIKMKKSGLSLRTIADETNLSLQTVRTILGRETRTDRTSIARLVRIDPEHQAVVSWKARKRTRAALPKRINETLKDGAALLKEAKGLGK